MNRIWRSRLTVLLSGLILFFGSFLFIEFVDPYPTTILKFHILAAIFCIILISGMGCICLNFVIVVFETVGPKKLTKEEKSEEIVEEIRQIETTLTQGISSKELSIIRNDLRMIEVDSKIFAMKDPAINSTIVKLFKTIENYDTVKTH